MDKLVKKIEVIVGTYEEFLLGYKVNSTKKTNGVYGLVQSFATRSHTGSIRSVATSGKYLASGGADDRIFVYDMKTRKEIQILMHHSGTVNALAFIPNSPHILSGGSDGQMMAVRVNTWQVEGQWKRAHMGLPLTHISCHPSGKLAFTLGGDVTIRSWNLIKGRLAYAYSLKSKQGLGQSPDCLSWSPNGKYFTITGPGTIEIWKFETAGVQNELTCQSKPTSVCWLDDTNVVFGLEDGSLMFIDILCEIQHAIIRVAHDARVKGLAYLHNILVSISSSGDISLWSVYMRYKTIKKIAHTNIGCRPTSIALLDLDQFDDDYPTKKAVNPTEIEPELKTTVPKEVNKVSTLGTVIIETEDEENIADTQVNEDFSLNDSLPSSSSSKISSTNRTPSPSVLQICKLLHKIRKRPGRPKPRKSFASEWKVEDIKPKQTSKKARKNQTKDLTSASLKIKKDTNELSQFEMFLRSNKSFHLTMNNNNNIDNANMSADSSKNFKVSNVPVRTAVARNHSHNKRRNEKNSSKPNKIHKRIVKA